MPAAAIRRTGFDLVVCGMASTDAEMSALHAMVAARLEVPQVTFAAALSVSGGAVTIRRDSDTASEEITAPLPALVSVTDQTGEARYPAFKAIMASKKKPVTTLSLADLGIVPTDVGLAAAATRIRSLAPRPPRQAWHRRGRRGGRRHPDRGFPRSTRIHLSNGAPSRPPSPSIS